MRAPDLEHVCTCGARFEGTLQGAWSAKLHAEAAGHRLRGLRATPAPAGN